MTVARHRPAGTPLSQRWWISLIVALLIAVLCSVIAYARIPAADRGVVWAEDGRFFLAQRYQLGMGGSLFHVYEGYLQFAPRILTDIATHVAPLVQYGLTVTRLVSVTTGVIAALVFFCSRDVVASLWARVALALITVLAPMLPIEVLGNMANVHWIFLWLSPWLLLFRPTRWWQSGVVAALLLVTVLTEIQALVFIPLIVFQIRHRKTWPVGAALLVGGAFQVAASVLHPRDPNPGPPITALNIVLGYVQNVLVGGTTGTAASTAHWLSTYGWKIGLVFAVPFVLATLVVILRSKLRDYPAFLAVLAGGTVFWVASAVANADPRFEYSGRTQTELGAIMLLRYGVVPSMFLLALVVLAADKLLAWRPIPARMIGALVLIATVVVQLHRFDAPVTRRDGGPDWAIGYRAAVATCVVGAPGVSIRTAPAWNVVLPCPVVLAHR